MSDYEHILVEKTEGVAIITMNRPEVLNAMNFRLTSDLHDAVRAMGRDEEVGCIVVTGAGDRAFSAGGDIHEQRENDANLDPAELARRGVLLAEGNYDVATCPKPTIGMVNGLAYGGASVLVTALDMRIGCEDAKFRFLAAAYGRINATWTLPNQVGWPMAKELLFSGRLVEAEEAHRIGLLNHLVPRAELRARTMELATTIAANKADSVRGVKELLLRDLGESLKEQWSHERVYTRDVVRGAKAEDAFPEFIERKGRPL